MRQRGDSPQSHGLREPALPVLGLGVVGGAVRLSRRAFLEAVGPLVLAVLLLVAVVVNNLPAASLLSAHPSAHPQALLIGFSLGPNLAVSGSLSALIWWRAARRLDARPSARTYTLAGAPLAVVAILASLSLSG